MEDFNRLNPSAQKLWTIHGIIVSLFLIGIAATLGFLLHFWWGFIVAIPISFYWCAVSPAWEMVQWKYRIVDTQIDLIHGVFFRKHTVIPISPIQHMDIKQGPLQKQWGLATLTLMTAASAHEIPAITMEQATAIAQSLNATILREEEHERV